MTEATCAVAFVVVLVGLAWQVRTRSGWTWTAFWLSVAFIALLGPNLRFTPLFDTRLMALSAAAVAFVSRWGDADGRTRLRHELTRLARPSSRLELVWSWAIIALVGWICLSVVWSPAALTYVGAQFVFAAGLAVLVVVVLDQDELLRRAIVAMSIFVALATMLEIVLDPSGVRAGARLRGPFVDANTLGLIVAFALPALVVSVPRGRWLVVLGGLAVVWEAGTRAALLALAVAGVLAAWRERRTIQRHLARVWRHLVGRLALGALVLVAGAGVVVAIDKALATNQNDPSLLRSNNSRTEVWEASQRLVDQHPWRGLGIAGFNSDFQTGSSYYASMILLGVVGTVLLAVVLIASAILAHGRMNWLGLTLVSASVTGVFEGWILAPGAIFCVIFWVGLFAWVWGERTARETARTVTQASLARPLDRAE